MKELEKIAGISALRVLMELKKIAFSNLEDFKDNWMTAKEFEAIPRDVKAALSEIKHVKRTIKDSVEEIVTFRVHDKVRAIEVINKMLGYQAPEKVSHSGEVSLHFDKDDEKL